MNTPYQCVTRLGQGSILCAAKGTSIHTFDLDAGPSFLSSWTHPRAKQAGDSGPQETNNEVNEQESGQPPSKKRKLDSDKKSNGEGETNKADTGVADAAANGKKQKKARPSYQQQELPFVVLLASTEDGSHLVAVTSQDKSIWVFEHDGKGGLKELGQRAMPKRPSSIVITPGGNTILSADKFGDVYSLPLIPSPSASSEAPESRTPTPTPTPAPPSTASTATSTFKPAANRLTVHSARNRRALEEQERILASRKDVPKEGPAFEHSLILGHVSMLTALALATSDGKPYIITGDRDEHIRISRGVPQAHVIEHYCLGHESFLNALCVPAARPEILVSGGGDDELFVWDWKAGTLLRKVDLLGLIREVVPDASKVAVSHLYSYDVEGHCYVITICELVPAIFVFQLRPDSSLEHAQTLGLPGSPLDATIAPKPVGPLRLVVATDPHHSTATNTESQEDVTGPGEPSLLLFERDEAGNWARQGSIADIADGNLDLSREELEKTLYTVGKLRKTEFEDDAE
ncbi:hypothetical protein GGS26DRAFT_586532 [Hypomontagnella submonticulosa]|nr:hypothetical protein GGS26DRAFT_586532 [Hypomontagnella submonticulosa]